MALRRPILTLAFQLERTAPISIVTRTTIRKLSRSTTQARFSPPSICPLFTSPGRRYSSKASPSESQPTKSYTFGEILKLSKSELPDPNRILIDVREPAEVQSTGHIVHAQNVPLTSSPDAMFLPADEFEDRFGFPRPGSDVEVIFYCKSGVRSKAAARLAQQAGFGGTVSEYPGSWMDWDKNGGPKEGGR